MKLRYTHYMTYEILSIVIECDAQHKHFIHCNRHLMLFLFHQVSRHNKQTNRIVLHTLQKKMRAKIYFIFRMLLVHFSANFIYCFVDVCRACLSLSCLLFVSVCIAIERTKYIFFMFFFMFCLFLSLFSEFVFFFCVINCTHTHMLVTMRVWKNCKRISEFRMLTTTATKISARTQNECMCACMSDWLTD